jgi:nitroimidazol reductase NimA-like FMN-containing flavoprotein (pyridoxamine 5'-phosphate oxidase superfamily)
MLDIDEMSSKEIYELLRKIGYGHLGFIHSWGRAEVVAIYRVYPSEMSGRTTDGVSSRMMIA